MTAWSQRHHEAAGHETRRLEVAAAGVHRRRPDVDHIGQEVVQVAADRAALHVLSRRARRRDERRDDHAHRGESPDHTLAFRAVAQP